MFGHSVESEERPIDLTGKPATGIDTDATGLSPSNGFLGMSDGYTGTDVDSN